MSDARGQMGDNRPGYAAAARAELAEILERFVARRDEIISKADAIVIVRDRIDAEKATTIAGIGDTVFKMIDEQRKAISGPLYDGSRAANDFATEFWSTADEALRKLVARLHDFRERDRARREQQQLEQEQDEARRLAALAPAAPPPPPAPKMQPAKAAPIRSEFGYTARTRDVDVIEIEDAAALPSWIFESQPVIDAIISTVRPLVARKVSVPGIKVTKASKTRVGR